MYEDVQQWPRLKGGAENEKQVKLSFLLP